MWEQQEATPAGHRARGIPFPSFVPCRPRGSAQAGAWHRAPAEHSAGEVCQALDSQRSLVAGVEMEGERRRWEAGQEARALGHQVRGEEVGEQTEMGAEREGGLNLPPQTYPGAPTAWAPSPALSHLSLTRAPAWR